MIEKDFEGVLLEFNRAVALYEMCRVVGENESDIQEFLSGVVSFGYHVGYSSMIFEFVLTIGRILDESKDSVSLHNIINEVKLGVIDVKDGIQFNEVAKGYEDLRGSHCVASIRVIRNYYYAHASRKEKLGANPKIAHVFSTFRKLSSLIEQVGKLLGFEETIPDSYDYKRWEMAAKEFWSMALAENAN